MPGLAFSISVRFGVTYLTDAKSMKDQATAVMMHPEAFHRVLVTNLESLKAMLFSELKRDLRFKLTVSGNNSMHQHCSDLFSRRRLHPGTSSRNLRQCTMIASASATCARTAHFQVLVKVELCFEPNRRVSYILARDYSLDCSELT